MNIEHWWNDVDRGKPKYSETTCPSATCFLFGTTAPQWARASSYTRFLDHTQRRTAVGWTPPDEGSPRRRDIYLTTHNIQNRQTSMPPVGFELIISAGERPQPYALRRAATGIDWYRFCLPLSSSVRHFFRDRNLSFFLIRNANGKGNTSRNVTGYPRVLYLSDHECI